MRVKINKKKKGEERKGRFFDPLQKLCNSAPSIASHTNAINKKENEEDEKEKRRKWKNPPI